MRLLFILPEVGGHGGGIRAFYRPLLQRWSQAHECFVITGTGSVAAMSEERQVMADGTVHIQLCAARLDRWRKRFSRYALFPELQSHLAASWALREMAQELSPDVVEVCDLGLQFVAWVVDPPAPYIVQLHGSNGQISLHDPIRGNELESAITRLIEAAALPLAHAVQASAMANQRAWREAAGVQSEQMLPALDVSDRRIPWSSDLTQNVTVTDPVFRVFGRLQRWKGAETMALALRLRAQKATCVEWFGVDMPFEHSNWSTARQLEAAYPDVFGSSLIWKPQVSQSEVYSLQSKALCNVIPSVWDVFNFTVVEAMASGRPVICSRGAGASELIESGVSGLLFDAGDAEGLADALAQVQAMPEFERLRMAESALGVVRHRLDPGRSAQLRIEAYQAAIAKWHHPRTVLPRWVFDAVSPETGHPVDPWPVLDGLPLRGLAHYLGQRIKKRIRRNFPL